jgi:hypothetical protein
VAKLQAALQKSAAAVWELVNVIKTLRRKCSFVAKFECYHVATEVATV